MFFHGNHLYKKFSFKMYINFVINIFITIRIDVGYLFIKNKECQNRYKIIYDINRLYDGSFTRSYVFAFFFFSLGEKIFFSLLLYYYKLPAMYSWEDNFLLSFCGQINELLFFFYLSIF